MLNGSMLTFLRLLFKWHLLSVSLYNKGAIIKMGFSCRHIEEASTCVLLESFNEAFNMTNKKELEEAGIQIITGSRIRSESHGQSGDLSSPRSSKNKSMIRKISNLGAWRYGKYVSRLSQRQSFI